jgi:hypothetical protein
LTGIAMFAPSHQSRPGPTSSTIPCCGGGSWVPAGTPFDEDAGLHWHPLKRGKERPLELPAHKALVFGDRIVGVEGGLRYWSHNPVTDKRAAYFHRTTAPQLAHLLEIDFDRALVTHGTPVLEGGHQALENALAAEPWYPRPS